MSARELRLEFMFVVMELALWLVQDCVEVKLVLEQRMDLKVALEWM
jgi:hypothetical protein